MSDTRGWVALVVILVFAIPSVVDGVTNYSSQKEGDDVHGSIGPATTLCNQSNPDNCSPDHFDSGTSVHIGEHDNTEDIPWAFYEVVLNSPQYCVGDMSVEMRYQVNDIYHRSGSFSDHDVFVKLKDFLTGEYHILDSTVDTQTSNGGGDYDFGGTLDFGDRQSNSGNKYHQFGHGTDFVIDSTREFSHEIIPGTSQVGDYLSPSGSNDAKIGIYITANPEEDPTDFHHHTRVEVDWIRVNYDDENIVPENPSDPLFLWKEENMWPSPNQPTGPTSAGWHNPLSSLLSVSFGTNGYDACGLRSLEYIWQLDSMGQPSESTSGTEIFQISPENYSFTNILAPSYSGTYKFWFRAIDIMGNKADWESGDSISFDYTSPDLPTIDEDPSWYSEQNPPTLVWSAASDTYSGVSDYRIIQTGVGPLGDVAHVAEEVQYEFEIEGDSLSMGSNWFEIVARDHAEPVRNTDGEDVEILFDNNPPLVNNPISQNRIFMGSTPLIEWFYPLAFEFASESGVDYCFLSIDSIEVSPIPKDECNSSNGSISMPPLEDGGHTLTITACDKAGNCGSGEVRDFYVDSTMPELGTVQIVPYSEGDTWFAETNIRVSANFSDESLWGTGSGIDRVWHGIYPVGFIPTESQIKNEKSPPSVCQENSCMTHEFNENIDVQDGEWVWWYLAKDTSGNEIVGYHTAILKIDTTDPVFVSGPNLILDNNGEFVATWEADDGVGSGLQGYLYQIDSCNFSGQIMAMETEISFPSTSESHYICVMAMDKAGNQVIEIMDTNDPIIICNSLSEGGVFEEFSRELSCTISDDSSIDLSDDLGSVERILLDGVDITIDYSLTSREDEFVISLPPQGIGFHNIKIEAKDRFGRQSEIFDVQYFVSGYGVELTYWSDQGWKVLAPGVHEVMSFHWDKEDLEGLFRGDWEMTGVNVESLNESILEPYFRVIGLTGSDDPLEHLVRLDLRTSLQPLIGGNVSFGFSIDDGFSHVDYQVTIVVEGCPSEYFHNLSTDTCERLDSETVETNLGDGGIWIFDYEIVVILIFASGIVIFLYLRLKGKVSNGPRSYDFEVDEIDFEE